MSDQCSRCRRRMVRGGGPLPDGAVRHHGNGLCTGCQSFVRKRASGVRPRVSWEGRECSGCGRPMLPAGRRKQPLPEGWGRHCGHGVCSRCWAQANKGCQPRPDAYHVTDPGLVAFIRERRNRIAKSQNRLGEELEEKR